MSGKEVRNNEKSLPRVRPATDILERADGFYVYMDLPGVPRENLVLDLRENELAVSARTEELGGTGEKYLEVQFGPGEYRRTIALSDMIDREKIKAGLANGVLELFMPKAEKVLPRRIDIQSG